MKNKFVIILVCVFALSMVSCDFVDKLFGFSKAKYGTLNAGAVVGDEQLVGEGSKVIRPVLTFNISKYEWTLTGPSGELKEYSTNNNYINDSELQTGIWDVRVVGKNAAGFSVAEGVSQVAIRPVETTSVTIQLGIASGKGSLNLELTWPPGILENPGISASIERVVKAADGAISYEAPIDLDFALTAGNSGAVYKGNNLDSGYYIVSVRLLENGATTWGIREAVYIIKDEISSKKYELPGTSLKTKPLAPSRLLVQNYGKGDDGKSEIELRWQDNSDNEAQFVLMRKLKDDADFIPLEVDIAMEATSYIDKGLDKSKTYMYRIAAKNIWGMSDLSNSVTTTFPDIVEVNGDIEKEQKWTKEHSYLLSSGQVRIASGAKLTIEPGTLVKFSDGSELVVHGTLIADGLTGDSPASIIFSSGKLDAAAGSWQGVSFIGAESSKSIVKNCIFSDAKSVRFEDSYPDIDTVTVRNFNTYEGWNNYYGALAFNYSTGAGTSVAPYVVQNLTVNGSATGIRIGASSGAKGNVEFKNLKISNSVNKDLLIMNESPKMALRVCDSKMTGSSIGVLFYSSNASTVVDSCLVEGNNLGVMVQEYGTFVQNGIVSNSIIRNCQTGLQFQIPSLPTSLFKIQDNEINTISGWPLYVSSGINGVLIQGNTLIGNREGIYVNGSAFTRLDSNNFQGALYGREITMNGSIGVNAAYNYWGTSDLANIQSKIWDKRDDASLGEIKFQPYFTRPSQYLKPKYPIAGATVKEYEFAFSWESYKKPETVEFVLASDAAMSEVVVSESGDFGYSYKLSKEIRDSLQDGKQYFWKVGSVNEYGETAFGELNTFMMTKAGMDLSLLQFEEEVALESLPPTLYLGKTYAVKAVSTKKADSYRWTLGSELVQEGASEFLEIKPSLLGPGAYLLTVKAYFGERHTSATKSFAVEQMKVVAAWNSPWATVVELSDGLFRGWGNGIWINGNVTNAQNKIELDYGDVVDFQMAQGCYFWLKTDGTLWGAGSNYSGDLGIGSTGTYEYIPKRITQDVRAFSIGSQEMTSVFGVILKNDGSVYTWGENNNGQLGLGSLTRKSAPTKVDLPGAAVMVSAGHVHSLALLDTGKVMGWGYNETRPLGPVPSGKSHIFTKPVEIPGLSDIKSIHAGYHISYFISSSGKIKVLGRDHYGDSGVGQEWWTYEAPQSVSIAKPVQEVKNMEYATFALTESGELYSWGKSWEGTLGQKESNDYTVTTPRLVAENVSDFGVGRRHAWYIDTSGSFWIWGSNMQWQNGEPEQGNTIFLPAIVSW